MKKQLTHLSRGRLNIWWATHRHQLWPTIGILSVFCMFGVVGHYDYMYEIEVERMRAERKHALLEECQQVLSTQNFPKTVYLIEARDPKEAATKLNTLITDIGFEKYRLTAVQK